MPKTNVAQEPHLNEARNEEHTQRVARLEAEVEALHAQLRRSQRLATMGTMAAMVAHEFNNILTPIINYARLARKNPSLTAKAISRAEEGSERATHICQALLGMTVAESGRPEPVDVSRLINETMAAMARDPAKDGIELRFEAPADLTILTHRVQLQQVVLNLVLNARAAVMQKPAPRLIDVIAVRAGEGALIRVRDNGVGVAPEDLERIFEPFFTTKRDPDGDSGGHGLGLAVCRDIMIALDGEIAIDSELGVGTTFTLRLPKEVSAASAA